MSLRIEDYAMIGDCQTAALVSRQGSIDWLCFPRFDSPACFAALLGTDKNGRWLLQPAQEIQSIRRSYIKDTLVLETEFTTASGVVTVVDCMPPRSDVPDVIRLVKGIQGRVDMCMDLTVRFDYGSVVPWVRRQDDGLIAIAGPDALRLRTPVDVRGEDLRSVAKFTVAQGQTIPFDLTWFPSYRPEPEKLDAQAAVHATEEWWREWAGRCTYFGEWQEPVVRSLITLKALTYAPTGGIVAALTTSLPEKLGGVRNWDYRYCWLRDATFTLYALMLGGYVEEASAWREWLLRAVAGGPLEAQIMYGVAGERRLDEYEINWLPGYADSKPVRIGNAACRQFQLDVFGEVMDAFYSARRAGLKLDENTWRIQKELVESVETAWSFPDEGIWEVRAQRRHFTHSKVMAWVALDRAIKAVHHFGVDGPVQRWRRLREEIHAQVCREGFDPELNSFVQFYGAKQVDAALLMIPLVGFLPPTDPRMIGTVKAIQERLGADGFIARYETSPHVDGLPRGEGTFLACSFWLADNLILQGRVKEARDLFDRLLRVRNDVGLLAEEYDPVARRQLGNYPQAFSHVGLVNTARNLSNSHGPAKERKEA